MTIKTFSTKSNATRAIKKATEGYEAFITETEVLNCTEGFYGLITLKPGAGREVAEYLEARGMGVEIMDAPAARQTDDGPVAAEGSEEADEASLKEMLALVEAAEEPEAEDEATEEEIRDYLKGAFELAFINAGGNQGLGRCKALRAVAAEWEGSRKEFIQAAEDNGVHPATAGTQWQVGRSKR